MRLRKMLIAIPFTVGALVACQKDASIETNNNTLRLEAPKQQIKTGETFTVSLKNARSGAVAKWTVTPANGVEIDSMYSRLGNEIHFTKPGAYTVTAEVREVNVNCLPSPGWDTCYKNAAVTNILSGNVNVSN